MRPVVSKVRLAESDVSLASCEVRTLTATVLAEPGGSTALVWTTSDPNVASVSATGEVRAYETGVATITATFPDDPRHFASATLRVYDRDSWVELAGVEDAATHSRITSFVLQDSADILARYAPSVCLVGDGRVDVLSLVLTTTNATDLSTRGWTRAAPSASNWMRELPVDSDRPGAEYRTATFRLRTTLETPLGERVYPNGYYTASLRLKTRAGRQYIGVNGYPLSVDNPPP